MKNVCIINGVVYEGDVSIINGVVVNNSEISSSKDILEKQIEITQPILEINNRTCANIHFSTADDSVTIKATDGFMKAIQITTDGNKLSISMDGIINVQGICDIYISSKLIEKLSNHGVGNISGTINAKDLTISNHGTGNIELNGQAESINLLNSGVGKVKLKELPCKNMNVSSSGVGNLSVFVSEKITGHLSGIGNLKIHGGGSNFVTKSGLGSFSTKKTKEDVMETIEKSKKTNIFTNIFGKKIP